MHLGGTIVVQIRYDLLSSVSTSYSKIKQEMYVNNMNSTIPYAPRT